MRVDRYNAGNRKSILKMGLMMVLCCQTFLYSQGHLRSNGLGLRGGFWSASGETLSLNVSGASQANPEVQFDGFVGAWLYYFSRLEGNWFMEFNLGALSSINANNLQQDSTDVDLNTIIPFLIGVRHHFIPPRFPSRVQPYINAGIGPYWQSDIKVETNNNQTEAVSLNSKIDYGGFLGGGTNIALASWMALNFDVKYHFVDFKSQGANSGMEFNLGLAWMWGRRPALFRIQETRSITTDIYPAYYQYYNDAPLALVTVENTAGFPIEVNIRSRVHPFSRRWKNSGFVRLKKNEVRNLPVQAVFGSAIHNVQRRGAAVLEIEVEGRGGATLKREVSIPLTMHTSNSWNGDITMLDFFLTPDAPKVLSFSRELVKATPDSTPKVGNMTIARALFEKLGSLGIQYQNDPNIPFYKDDRVQYAAETLELGSGDCDDLVVLYASMLQSLGINTAFVRVKDPEKSIAHLYMLFDAGLPMEQAHLVSSNEKRYIVRESNADERFAGQEAAPVQTIWVPIETTMLPEGFDASWNAGALQYLQEGIVRNGISDGWVEIIDIY